MKWQERSRYERDFKKANDRFPKFKSDFDSKSKHWIIVGDLDICDLEGDYWGTFKIRIYVPQSYPYCIPRVQELSDIIPRHDDWHIDKNGLCCLDIDHRLVIQSRKGIGLETFIVEKVYSYFANQLYKLRNQSYAGDEYKHHFDGVMQFYRDDLNLAPEQAIDVLKGIINGEISRNVACPCGSLKKMKYCHWSSIQFLKSMEKARLVFDYHNFQNLEKD